MARQNRDGNKTLQHFLFTDNAELLDRYEALLAEDQSLRAAQYENPDPKRRRLRVMCNDCQTPWCCNHRVDVDLIEVLSIYRWAAKNAPAQLEAATRRGKELHERRRPYEVTEFFRRRAPCPFLVKGRCSIYAVRPYSCRTHYMAGNPLKCRDELMPSETYTMDPDSTLIAEMNKADEDLKFFNLIEGVKLKEMAEMLYFVERLAAEDSGKWRVGRTLDWAGLR